MLLRRSDPPELVTPTMTGKQTLYTVTLNAVPSPAWRATYIRPPPTVTTVTYRPELCRLDLYGAAVLFRTTPSQLRYWLHWIDRWVEYANSVVEE